VRRRDELAHGLAAEVGRWRDGSPLLPGEEREYLRAIQEAIASVEAGRVLMDRGVKRLEALNLPGVTGGKEG
jgi:hypothetical protein